MSDRRTPDAKLIEAVRILSRTINNEDGVIAACLGEVATRLEELVEERRSISTLLQKVESLEAENNRLRKENETLRDYWPTFWKPLPPLPPGPEGEA